MAMKKIELNSTGDFIEVCIDGKSYFTSEDHVIKLLKEDAKKYVDHKSGKTLLEGFKYQ